jgi:hypothetical protein
MGFAKDVQKFEIKVGKLSTEVIKKIVFEMYTRIVLRTRFDTGRARGNWMISIGGPATGTSNRTSKSGPVGSELAQLSAYRAGDVWITNNLNYIRFLENGTRSFQGDHMVSRTVAEFRSIVKGLV